MTSAPDADSCRVTWWGHSAASIELDGVHVVTDPLLRRRVGPLHFTGHRPSPRAVASTDAILLSHLHRDHTDLPSLARFPGGSRIVVPVGGGTLVRPRVRATVQEIDVGETTQVGHVTVRATYADHDGRRGRRHTTVAAVGYLLLGSRSVYVAGDTDIFPGMLAVREYAGERGLDVVLLPVGGWGLTLGHGHLDPSRAAEALALLRPRVAIPVHWGTLRPPLLWRTRPRRYVRPADDFASHAAAVQPDTRVITLRPGQSWAATGVPS